MEDKIIELRRFVQFDFYTVNELFVLQLFEPDTCSNDIGVSCIWEVDHFDFEMLFDSVISWCKEKYRN